MLAFFDVLILLDKPGSNFIAKFVFNVSFDLSLSCFWFMCVFSFALFNLPNLKIPKIDVFVFVLYRFVPFFWSSYCKR